VTGRNEIQEMARTFLGAVQQAPQVGSYKILPSSSLQIYSDARSRLGEDCAADLLRCALTLGARGALSSKSLQELPPRVRRHHETSLIRIADNQPGTNDWLTPESDLFQKELGLVSFRLLSFGQRVGELGQGIPRRTLWVAGLSNAPRRFLLILRLGGFRPYIQTHLHDFELGKMDNEAGRTEMYLCGAELLERYPELLGTIGSSWLEDPALEQVSPRLFNRQPREGGAVFLYNGTDSQTTNNALFRSETRRALYQQGRYQPKNYMVIWPREQQIDWARRRKNP
jgi:hypothetical protein